MKALINSLFDLCIICMICAMVSLSGCSKDSDRNYEPTPVLEETSDKSSENITEEEIASLMFMVEEEKLAGDVYLKMLALYGLEIFDNILQSERKHVAAISKLIEKYELDNPIIGNDPGVFVNEELQQLYDDLVETGSLSKKAAINVGVTIEETDMVDIQAYLDSVVEREDIHQVYTNLLNGSENHLAAFISELK